MPQYILSDKPVPADCSELLQYYYFPPKNRPKQRTSPEEIELLKVQLFPAWKDLKL